MLIDELFEQTDESITNGGDEKVDKKDYEKMKKFQKVLIRFLKNSDEYNEFKKLQF